MKAARAKGVETIINPAPAISLPDEVYQGLGHLIVNETEAAILSGIENPTSWDDVAAVFVSRGVKNIIITLGGDVSHVQKLVVIKVRVLTILRESTTKLTRGTRSQSLAILSMLEKFRLWTPLLPVILSQAHILLR
jgi:hypothetical protein